MAPPRFQVARRLRFPNWRSPSADHVELIAARKWIAELKIELAIHRRAAELLGDVVLHRRLRADVSSPTP